MWRRIKLPDAGLLLLFDLSRPSHQHFIRIKVWVCMFARRLKHFVFIYLLFASNASRKGRPPTSISSLQINFKFEKKLRTQAKVRPLAKCVVGLCESSRIEMFHLRHKELQYKGIQSEATPRHTYCPLVSPQRFAANTLQWSQWHSSTFDPKL